MLHYFRNGLAQAKRKLFFTSSALLLHAIFSILACRFLDWNTVAKVRFATAFYLAVFLGGACNPTTWRQDTAIPFLDAVGISYYNPVSYFISLDMLWKV